MNNDNPSYYAIIPASVRYDKSLCANAKLLYGEITALCNKEGYCWASNNYFAELYGVHKNTVSKWFTKLKKARYVDIEVNEKERGYERKVYINEKVNTPKQKGIGGINEKVDPSKPKGLHNNTINNTPIITFNKRFKPPTKEQLMEYCNEIQFVLDHSYFLDYYTTRGWKLKGEKMVDWKGAVRTWKTNASKWDKDKPGKQSIDEIHEANVKLFGGETI